MKTLYDLGMEVMKIREAINSLEVKGKQNASLIVYAFGKCDEIIEAINEISKEAGEKAADQNGEEAEVNGIENSGTS